MIDNYVVLGGICAEVEKLNSGKGITYKKKRSGRVNKGYETSNIHREETETVFGIIKSA